MKYKSEPLSAILMFTALYLLVISWFTPGRGWEQPVWWASVVLLIASTILSPDPIGLKAWRAHRDHRRAARAEA
jgi:hypothetical protein